MTESKPTIGVSIGDPAGIGSEIIVKAYDTVSDFANVLAIGDVEVVRDACRICDSSLDVVPVSTPRMADSASDELPMLPIDAVDDIEYGVVKKEYGEAALKYAETAANLALDGEIDAITSAPINRESVNLAEKPYDGELELLADVSETDTYSILLIEDDLRVAHVTAHVPLSGIFDRLTVPRILTTIQLSDEGLRSLGIEEPTIAVAGLNPHAGMDGLLGSEEASTIGPAVERARDAGIDAVGPESPDTVFAKGVSGQCDCVVALYHDQGHIAVKTLSFESANEVSGISMTAGFPFARTTVDHGTAFDIAGQGVASPASMTEAIRVASQIASRR